MTQVNVLPDRDKKPDDVAKFLTKLPTRCLLHEEPVISFCVEHDQLICNACGLSAHSQCDNIVGLLEASKGFRNSREVTILNGNFKKLKQKYEKVYKEQTDILNDVIEREKTFVSAVHAFRDEINAILQRLENALMAKKDDYVIKKKNIHKGT